MTPVADRWDAATTKHNYSPGNNVLVLLVSVLYGEPPRLVAYIISSDQLPGINTDPEDPEEAV